MNIFSFLFGCWHSNYSFPLTKDGRTYICCLDCGRELPYDWERMKIVRRRTKVKPEPTPQPVQAAEQPQPIEPVARRDTRVEMEKMFRIYRWSRPLQAWVSAGLSKDFEHDAELAKLTIKYRYNDCPVKVEWLVPRPKDLSVEELERMHAL